MSIKVLVVIALSIFRTSSLSCLEDDCGTHIKDQIPLSIQKEDKSPFPSSFDDFVTSTISHWHVPGLTIAIVDNNSTFSKGYGISQFPSQPVTPQTLFYAGSTTKAFTTAALALLIDSNYTTPPPNNHVLSWRTPVSSLIGSDFVLPLDWATIHVTLEDVASHRTGMPAHDISYGGANFTIRDAARSLHYLPMTEEPRVRFQYCNVMYMALSHVIETLTGKWLGDVLYERIWKSLGMNRTYLSLRQARATVDDGEAELARGYVWNNRTGKYVPLPYMDRGFVSGAGAVISNVLDYATWLRFLIDQSPPLSPAGHAALRAPRIPLDIPDTPAFTGVSAYGLGWFLVNYHGEPLIWHSGVVPGFGAFIGYLPRKKWGLVLMANTDTSGFAQDILAFRLLDEKLGIPEDERVDLGRAIEDGIQKQADRTRHPKKYLYPNAPHGEDVVPLARPLEAYTGLYTHPGYQTINITRSTSSASPMSTGSLQVCLDRVLSYVYDFEHVSGEFFVLIAHMDMPDEDLDLYDPLHITTHKGEFRLGEDGEVKEFGVGLEEAMGEKKIWFRRVV